MSILLETPQAGATLYQFMGSIAVIALAIASGFGIFRLRSIVGPRRLAKGEDPRTLLLILFIIASAWVAIPVFYMGAKQAFGLDGASATQPASSQSATTQTSAEELSPTEQVCLGAATAPLLLLLGIALTRLYRPGGLVLMGLSPRRLPAGFAVGTLAIVLILPVMWWVNLGTEAAWDALNLPHENEHELLKFMGESTNSMLVDLAAISAVVLAPLFEEFVFRGYLQTLFVAALAPYFRGATEDRSWRPAGLGPMNAPGKLPVTAPSPEMSPIAPAELSASPMRAPAAGPGGPQLTGVGDQAPALSPAHDPAWAGAAARWGGILLASLLFALVHPWWMRPPIFFLSVCLGYVYERTGNLWASIAVHALFNFSSVFLYLSMPPH